MYAVETCAVAPKSKMDLSLESVYERALKLNDIVNNLNNRLAPISAPQPEDQKGTNGSISPCKAQGYVLDQLDMIADQIDKAHSTVLTALNALEI